MSQASIDPLALAPEIMLLGGSVVCLLTGSFVRQDRQWVSRLVAMGALVACALAAATALTGPARLVYDGSYAIDAQSAAGRIIVALAALLVIVLGSDELAGAERESEAYTLILLASLGAVVLAGTTDLLVLAAGFLLASIPLYALIGMQRTPPGAEAALKTYLLGALTGISMLFGITVLYGLAGTSDYRGLAERLSSAPVVAMALGLAGVLAGLLFKAGAVPAHFWVPDAAQGASTTAAAYATTVPKIGAFLAVYRLLSALPTTVNWPLLVALLAVITMTLGNLAAYPQTDPRRLLGWSTVSQAGYLLMPVAVAGHVPLARPALIVYLAGYAVSNLTAFAVVAALPTRTALRDYAGLARTHPWLTMGLVVALLSLVGTPPTAVFLGKLAVFTAAWDGGWWWLTVAAAANTVLSLFYYLRWIAPAFAGAQSARGNHDGRRPWAAGTVVVGAVTIVAFGVGAGLGWAAMAP